ncbi:MAG: threonine aldolase family protein [Actinomycetota bacterium]
MAASGSASPPHVVDLRSDTLTLPTPAMRAAMASAEVGDDMFGEDPTVNLLQERVAALCGKEAALYVPSGSMGNLVLLKALTQPGDEVICHEDAHIVHFESGSLAAVAGVQVRTLPGPRGRLDPDLIARSIRPPHTGGSFVQPRSRVVALENTHNMAGGTIYPLDAMRVAASVARDAGLLVHLDGARIWNASVATGIPVATWAACADTMSLCFSKGLGAPVGSMVVGPAGLIDLARRYRKMFGGAMRQAGVLAAACLVAVDTMVARLAEDHANARALAEGIAGVLPGAVDPAGVDTNIVLVRAAPFGTTPEGLTERLAAQGVKVFPHGAGTVRMVTHNGVSPGDVPAAVAAVARLAGPLVGPLPDAVGPTPP